MHFCNTTGHFIISIMCSNMQNAAHFHNQMSHFFEADVVGCQVLKLTGTGGQAVVVFDYSDEELFGEGIHCDNPNVLVADLHLEVEECAATDYGEPELTDVGFIRILKPLPPGWPDDVQDDNSLSDQLHYLEGVQRMADAGCGNYHMWSSTEFTEGNWGGEWTWRVFYDANFGAPTLE